MANGAARHGKLRSARPYELLQRRLAAKKGICPPPNRAKVPVLRSVYRARLTAARARLWRPCRRGVERLHGCARCIGCLERLHPLGWPAGNMQQSSLNRVVLDEDYGLGKMVVKLEDFLRRRSKISQVVRREDILASPGLAEACSILFGDAAELRLSEYTT